MIVRLSKRVVDAAHADLRDLFLWDQAVTGFGLKVTPAGVRVYILQYRCKGRQRRYTIGRHGSPWTVDEARTEAKRLLAEVVRGHDPADLKQAERGDVSFGTFAERYLREHVALHKKASSAALDNWLLKTHILPALGSRRLGQISRGEVARLHRSLAETPIAANRVLGLTAVMLNLAERWGLRPEGSNPCKHVEKFKERSRERFLSEIEIARLGEALGQAEAAGASPVAIAAIRLLILTGARKGEILSLQWRFVSFERQLLELPDSKTGAKVIYLAAPALALLSSLPRLQGNPYVLPGDRTGGHLVGVEKTWYGVRKAAELEDVRIHDLRHSFAAIGASAGFSLPLIGALLGHTEISTTQRYAHLADDPVRQAGEAIAKRIADALGPARAAS